MLTAAGASTTKFCRRTRLSGYALVLRSTTSSYSCTCTVVASTAVLNLELDLVLFKKYLGRSKQPFLDPRTRRLDHGGMVSTSLDDRFFKICIRISGYQIPRYRYLGTILNLLL